MHSGSASRSRVRSSREPNDNVHSGKAFKGKTLRDSMHSGKAFRGKIPSGSVHGGNAHSRRLPSRHREVLHKLDNLSGLLHRNVRPGSGQKSDSFG